MARDLDLARGELRSARASRNLAEISHWVEKWADALLADADAQRATLTFWAKLADEAERGLLRPATHHEQRIRAELSLDALRGALRSAANEAVGPLKQAERQP